MKFYDVMIEWLEFHALSVSQATIYNYSKSVQILKSSIGQMDVEEMSREDIQSLFIDFFHRGLRTNTMINYGKPINQTLKFAVSKGYISESPYVGITIPKTEEYEIKPFTEGEVEKLLELDLPLWFRDAVQLAFRTGMRKSEIFALSKNDIDLGNAFLMVRHTQSMIQEGYVVLKSPKTKGSKRRIALDNISMEILRRRYATCKEYIFEKNGEMMAPSSINSMLRRRCKQAGIAIHRFHDLRHGHATFLLKNNVHPKIVQERLGHADISITLDTYSHLIPGMQAPAVDIINTLGI